MNIQRTKYNAMRPHIEVKPLPINNYTDDIENDAETHCLYHVLVSQGKLKMLFLVAQRPLKEQPIREFDVVRCEYISLHGISERDTYLEKVNNISISADATIVNDLFSWTLAPYGIKLLKVVFHNFEFFETEVEGNGFVFEDQSLYNRLKDLINKRCSQMLRNPYIIEY